MQRLAHAGIVPVLEIAESADGPYFVCPTSRGETSRGGSRRTSRWNRAPFSTSRNRWPTACASRTAGESFTGT